jgi:hypothetical protein
MMKKILFLYILNIFCALAFAQAPQGFNYQSIIRDNTGGVLSNRLISIQISILEGSVLGNEAYIETHQVATNEFGLINLIVGQGSSTFGNFQSINWATNSFFIKTELDINNGNNFQFMGTSQLMSVPYALFAENAVNVDDDDADPTNEIQTIAKNNNLIELSKNGGSIEQQTLSQDGSLITLSDGGGTININDADADPNNEIQTLSRIDDLITLSQGGGSVNIQDNDADPTNEIQAISLENNILTLSNGGSIDLSSYLDNTDQQTLSIVGNELQISGGNSVVLSGAVDLDSDPTNEIQTLSIVKDTLFLSQANYVIIPPDIDNDTLNEIQFLSLNNDTIFLSKGGFIPIPIDNDKDSLNEIQQLILENDSIKLSKGSGGININNISGGYSTKSPGSMILSNYNSGLDICKFAFYNGIPINQPNGTSKYRNSITSDNDGNLYVMLHGTSGGGYGNLLIGNDDFSASSNYILISKLDTNCQIIWNKQIIHNNFYNYSIKNHNEFIYVLGVTGTNGFSVDGITISANRRYILKIDADNDGTVISSLQIPLSNYSTQVYDFCIDNNDHLFIQSSSNTSNYTIGKYDLEFNLISSFNYNGNINALYQMDVLPNGNIAYSFYAGVYPSYSYVLRIINNNGDLISSPWNTYSPNIICYFSHSNDKIYWQFKNSFKVFDIDGNGLYDKVSTNIGEFEGCIYHNNQFVSFATSFPQNQHSNIYGSLIVDPPHSSLYYAIFVNEENGLVEDVISHPSHDLFFGEVVFNNRLYILKQTQNGFFDNGQFYDQGLYLLKR